MGSFRSWIRVVRQSGGIDREYLPRLLAVSLVTLLTSPLRLYESARFGRLVERTRIDPAPIFILGHWRTGTTHLHNLLCRDPRFGYLSTFQAMAPGFCLAGEKRIKPALARLARKTHPTREIDNVPLDLDAPQEESFALANCTPCAPLHLYWVPRRAAQLFDRYALFEGISEDDLAEWTGAYLAILRKATLRSGGKPLVLKDPAHSGRIPKLLALFPEAKFIHICRDPYRVIPSTIGMYHVVMRTAQLQSVSSAEVEALVVNFYERLMRKYLAEKSLIPRGNLVEVRYETLEESPIEEMRRIYEDLRLPEFGQVEPAMRQYIESVRGFQKNTYRVDDQIVDLVNRRLRFALEAWNYPRLEPRGTGSPI